MTACRIMLFLAASACTGTAAAQTAPADVVRPFYTTRIAEEASAEARDQFTDPARARLDANQRVNDAGDLGCVDFGLAVDAQDYDEVEIARTLKLDQAVEGDKATVTARFSNFGDEQIIEWDLRNVGGKWLISDIASTANEWRLSDFDCEQ